MNWIFEKWNLENLSLNEPLLDCINCRVSAPLERPAEYKSETRCCLFKPYWSALAIGHWLSQGGSEAYLKSLWEKMVFLPIGLLHPLGERQENPKTSCGFYSSENGLCGIWNSRPATCQSFFCVSQKRSSAFYSSYEEFLMIIESDLMERWFFERGGDQKQWLTLVEYFDEDCVAEIPQVLLERSFKQAVDSYRSCYQWFKETDFCEMDEHLQRYQLLVEEHGKLC